MKLKVVTIITAVATLALTDADVAQTDEKTTRRRLTFSDVDAVIKESARRRLATVRIDLVIEMDTCAERGFTSNDECLASLMTALEEAAASGLLAERLKYWADYYDVPFEDINLGINNITFTFFNSSWVFAPTSKPTYVPTPMPPSPAPSPGPTPEPTLVPTLEPTAKPSSRKVKDKKKAGLASGEIAAIVIGSLLILCCCVLLTLYFGSVATCVEACPSGLDARRRRRANQLQVFADDEEDDSKVDLEAEQPRSVRKLSDVQSEHVAASDAPDVQVVPQALQKLSDGAEL